MMAALVTWGFAATCDFLTAVLRQKVVGFLFVLWLQ